MTHTFSKTTIAAAAAVVATSLFAFQPSEAEAKVYIDLHLVAPTPNFGTQPPPPRRRAAPPPQRRIAPGPRRMSCNQVRRVLRNNYGYYNIRAFDCKGKSYWFYASKNGKQFKVKAASTTGQVIRKHRI